jgi:hypothetical protein
LSAENKSLNTRYDAESRLDFLAEVDVTSIEGTEDKAEAQPSPY